MLTELLYCSKSFQVPQVVNGINFMITVFGTAL